MVESALSEYQCTESCKKNEDCAAYAWDSTNCFIVTFDQKSDLMESKFETHVAAHAALISGENAKNFEALQQAADKEFQQYLDYLNNETLPKTDDPKVFTRKDAAKSIFGESEHRVNILAAEIPDESEYSIVSFNNGKQFTARGANLKSFQLEQMPILRNVTLKSTQFETEEKLNGIKVTSNQPVTFQAANDFCQSVFGHLSHKEFPSGILHKEYLLPEQHETFSGRSELLYRLDLEVSEEPVSDSTILTVVCGNDTSISLTWRDGILFTIHRWKEWELKVKSLTSDRQISFTMRHWWNAQGKQNIHVYNTKSPFIPEKDHLDWTTCSYGSSIIFNNQISGIKTASGEVRSYPL